MPDTKTGRERKGRNKRQQLESHLARREIDTLDDDDDLPQLVDEVDSEFLVDPSETEDVLAGDD